MAERRIHTTGRPWEAQGGYARAVRIGGLVETSLCSPADEDGKILFPGRRLRQTQVSLRVVGEGARAGMDFGDVTRRASTSPIRRAGSRRRKAHAEVFAAIRPALGFVYMSGFFHPDIAVEVEATAYRPGA